MCKSWGRLSNKTFSLNYFNKNNGTPLAIGNLRSYGDQALSANFVNTKQNDRVLKINSKELLITCEAGILLRDLRDVLNKYDYDIPVVPGTSLITIGGAVSNDIHGKSHHKFGSFGNIVNEIVINHKNTLKKCSRKKNIRLFRSVIGGMGLVGEIIYVTISIIKTNKFHYLLETIPFRSIDDYFSLSESSLKFDDTVGWFDCTNRKYRGVFFRANRVFFKANKNKKQIKLNYFLNHKFSLINRLSIYFFNNLYYFYHLLQTKKKIISFDKFHHPLDTIDNWNKLYGSNGFYQFQCVLPKKKSRQVVKLLLDHIRISKQGSFLCVIKNFGEIKSIGYLSFPMNGTTIAIDFTNKGIKTKQLIKNLYDIVLENGGRIYLAKDALLTKSQFIKNYPDLTNFKKYRDKTINSKMSLRLGI